MDLVQGVTTLTYGGTLTVTNLAGTLASGQAFKLFNATTYSGSFSTFNLPSLGPSLGWNTSTLATNGTISVIVTGTATVVTPASANWTAGATTVSLSVLGADAAGEQDLTYTWSSTGPAGVTYSANGTNAAKNSTATLTAAGSYTFTATITDVQGPSTTSSASVIVSQTVTSIVVSPTSAVVQAGTTQNYSAAASDQFGAAMTVAPSFTWSSTVGSLNASGVFTAQSTSATGTVTAAVGGVHGSAPVRVDALPVAVADSYAALASSTLSVAAPGVLTNDTGTSGTAITAVLVSNPAHGHLSLASNGSFQYTPTTGYTGSDSFTYKVYDGYFYSSPTTVTLSVAWPTWTGLGGDNHWTTAANWANSLAPQAGDELIFTGSTQTTSVNDYPAGTQFSSMSIQGGNFTLQGNQVDLTSPGGTGITSAGSNNSINLPIDLLANTTISNSSGALTMGAINNGGYTLTVNAASGTTANLSGAMQGSGGLQFTGTGTVNSSAASTIGGTTTVASGKFIINSASSFPVGGSLIIGTPSSPAAVFSLASSAAQPVPTIASTATPAAVAVQPSTTSECPQLDITGTGLRNVECGPVGVYRSATICDSSSASFDRQIVCVVRCLAQQWGAHNAQSDCRGRCPGATDGHIFGPG